MNTSNYKDLYITTYTGKRLYFFDLHPDQIDLEDIVRALSYNCRYSGHCRKFYSIAQHSMFVADMVSERAKSYALLHDAGESYMSDMARPLKILFNSEFDNFIKKMEHKILHCVNEHFNLPNPSDDIIREVKLADNTALWFESKDLFTGCLDDWNYGELINPLPKIDFDSSFYGFENIMRIFKKEICRWLV